MQKKVMKKKVAEPVAVVVEAPVAVVPAVEASPKTFKRKTRPNLHVVLFTIEGGEGYRCSTFSGREQFEKYLAAPGQKNHPKPLTQKWFLIDMTNGTITPEK